jgi:pimeloyl-ACP methyl ester carboxylesterase
VFLHDGLGSIESLRGFPEHLAEATGLAAFGYDRWGYGRSDARAILPVPIMEDYAARLPRVLEAAGIAEHIVIGHSDGGSIALLHAMANPAGLRASVSIAAHVQNDTASRTQLARHGEMASSDQIPDWLIRFQGERARAAHLMEQWVRAWRATFAGGWDLGERLATIHGPLLALHGECDDYGEPGQLAAIRRAVPHAECDLLPGLAHFPHLDDPEGVVARIAEFVKRYGG